MMKWLSILILSVFTINCNSQSQNLGNGFKDKDPLIPADKIMKGGPPRDGIPSIDKPRFQTSSKAKWLDQNDELIILKTGNEVRAYPIKILNYHEIVNDEIGGKTILVSYCPLCGSAMVFNREIGGKVLEFGVSGLLYKSDMLLYDRETESLWSQIRMQAISGPMKGERLELISSKLLSFNKLKAAYPKAKILSRETGFNRNYSQSPYPNYESSERLMFPVDEESDKLRRKEKVLGLSLNDEYKAYPYSEFQNLNKDTLFNDEISNEKLTFLYDVSEGKVFLKSGSAKATEMYWFAWYAFHPNTSIFRQEN